MKKIISLILAVVLVLSMAMIASATTTTIYDSTPNPPEVQWQDRNRDSQTATVTVTGTKTPVYNVEVTWTSLEFTYNFGNDMVWNPGAHDYDGDPTGWVTPNATNPTVTVVNHSNAQVKCTVSAADLDGDDGCGVTLDNGVDEVEKILANAEVVAYGDAEAADSLKVTIVPTGAPHITKVGDTINIATITALIETVV